jgi:hypothetical protein
MIGDVSSTQPNTFVAQYPAVRSVPFSSKAAAPTEDTVQLSSQAQRILASSKQIQPATSQSFSQIIKEAANGDILALARLALIA